MNFLNLGLGELLGLVGAVSAGLVALYLLDRSKHKHIVATLRFWTQAESRTELQHRRRIQQPWSLFLQILSLALLLTAIAGPTLGVFDGPGRDHVVIVDTSAWMGSLTNQGTLLDQAKANAIAYINALPRRDRVMIVRADAVATPATAFELDRATAQRAIGQSQAGASALNLSRALDFAERAQSLQAEAPGEVVYIGASRVQPFETTLAHHPSNLRVIATKAPLENVGLRKVAMRRSLTNPEMWEIFVSVHNYGAQPHPVDLALQYAESPVGARHFVLAPGADQQAAFTYKQQVGGWLEARLNVRDAIPQDDRATIEVPSKSQLKAIVYSEDPQLKPLFSSNPLLDTEFRAPSAYDAAAKADIVVLDRFAPPAPPKADAIWIEPPSSGSPIPVKSTQTKIALDRWNTDNAIGAGLYTRDVTLESAQVFTPAPGDLTVASTKDGPVVIARSGAIKNVAIGFHPTRGAMKFELATPLLIANILRWMTPGATRRNELEAGTVGTVTVPVTEDTNPADVKVLDESNTELPFTIDGDSLHFFSGSPGAVRVQLRDRELLYALTLPDLAEAAWQLPAGIKKGVPSGSFTEAASTEIWPWLAIAGALGLLIDWILFGRNRAVRLTMKAIPANLPWKRETRKAS